MEDSVHPGFVVSHLISLQPILLSNDNILISVLEMDAAWTLV